MARGRLGKDGKYTRTGYRSLIREMCVKHCCCGSWIEADNCQSYSCPLWPARMGTGTPEPLPDFELEKHPGGHVKFHTGTNGAKEVSEVE